MGYNERLCEMKHHTVLSLILCLQQDSNPGPHDLKLDLLGFSYTSALWVILCHLPEKGRKEIEEIVEEMKEKDREENGK